MTSTEILKLIDAGYTKAEIEALDNPQNSQDNPQDQQPDQQKDQQQDQKQDQQQDQQKDTAQEFMNWMKKVNDSMEKVIKTMQASNLQNDSVDSVGKDINANVDKIMQSIIRQEQKEVK